MYFIYSSQLKMRPNNACICFNVQNINMFTNSIYALFSETNKSVYGNKYKIVAYSFERRKSGAYRNISLPS